jgi:Mrp family chromosome partitioning ATPase
MHGAGYPRPGVTSHERTSFAVERGVIAFHLRTLRARLRILVAVTVAALVLGIVWVAQRPPTYDATAQVLVSPLPQGDVTFFGVSVLRDAADTTRTLNTAVTLLDTPSAAARASREMGSGWTRRQVSDAVSVMVQPAANIVDIQAEAASPREAAKLANAFARAGLGLRSDLLSRQATVALRRARTQLESLGKLTPDDAAELLVRVNKLSDVAGGTDPTMTLAEPATVADRPGGLPDWLLVLAVAIGGLALGAGAVLMVDLVDRRASDEDEVLETYPLPVLTRIPTMTRQQRSALLAAEPALPWTARERFRLIEPQLTRRAEPGRSILVTSPSGGDGKTTAALSLALAVASADQRVLLVDLDLRRAELSERLGMRPDEGPEHLLNPGTGLEDLAVELPGSPSASVLPAAPTRDVALVEAMLRRLMDLIDSATAEGYRVVIDAPALVNVGDSLWLAERVDDVILVVRPGSTFRAHLAIARDMLERAGVMPDGVILIGGPVTRGGDYGSYGYGSAEEAATPLRRLTRLGR